VHCENDCACAIEAHQRACAKGEPKVRIYIPFYSRYGNVEQMAKAVGDGVVEAGGEAILAYVHDPCTPPEVIAADERWVITYERLTRDYPQATPEELAACDGACFGTPTRFGNAAAPMRNFFDMMAPLWMSGALINKPGAVFVSTATLHGGQEATTIATWLPLVHLGMVIVGVPYSEQILLTTRTGGTPYGPSHVAGQTGERPLDEDEAGVCRALGRRVALLAEKLKA